MPLRLSTKFSAAMAGVVLLAIGSSLVAVFSTRHIGNILQATLHDHDAIVNAEEMEVSLLGQEGLVASYIVSNGEPRWLDQLDTWRTSFEENLSAVRGSIDSPHEREILDRIEAEYRQLDKDRKEVIEHYEKGQRDEADKERLNIIGNRFYARIYDQCESLIDAIEHRVDTMGSLAQDSIHTVTWMVGACVSLTIAAAALLVWWFFQSVVFPLRRMAADARAFSGESSKQSEVGKNLPIDELRVVGEHIRGLMSDVADSRATLEHSHAQLLHAEKLASVGKLAASVAHEIRNPLTAIKMWLYSLRKAVGNDPEIGRRFDVVSEEIARLEKILQDFLAFSRPRTVKARPEQVSQMIDKTLELFGPRIEGKKIRLLREVADRLPPVMADAEQLRQVWINLLNNAADAAGESGEIRVLAGAEREADNRQMVVVRIANTGPAMPEHVKQRIFEPFFSTKEDGTGLGLCIAASIMAQHGGRLVLEASTPELTMFAVWIPVAKATHTDSQSPLPPGEG
jgi:signal transduction histidine kinase